MGAFARLVNKVAQLSRTPERPPKKSRITFELLGLLLDQSNVNGCDRARFIASQTTTCSWRALVLLQSSRRQAIKFHSASS